MLNRKDFSALLFGSFLAIFLNSTCFADLNVIDDASANPGGQGHRNGNGAAHGHMQGMGHQNQSWHSKNFNNHSIVKSKARFSHHDNLVITRYYSANPFPITTLPPGIAKNLLRGKPLPPGIAKVFLPSDLIAQLPVYPGYEYLVAGRDVLLVNSTNAVVADILSNVLR